MKPSAPLIVKYSIGKEIKEAPLKELLAMQPHLIKALEKSLEMK